jgi:hypothetical protein
MYRAVKVSAKTPGSTTGRGHCGRDRKELYEDCQTYPQPAGHVQHALSVVVSRSSCDLVATPVDIFPEIKIPVFSITGRYKGLGTAEQIREVPGAVNVHIQRSSPEVPMTNESQSRRAAGQGYLCA